MQRVIAVQIIVWVCIFSIQINFFLPTLNSLQNKYQEIYEL